MDCRIGPAAPLVNLCARITGAGMVDELTERAAMLRHFPQLAAIVALPGGWDCQACLAGGRVYKFPHRAEGGQALRREAALLALARQVARVAVPKVQVEPGPPVFSWHQALPGGQLEPQEYRALDAAGRYRLAGDLAGFLADVHGIGLLERMPPDQVAAQLGGLLAGREAYVARQVLRAVQALPDDTLGEVFGQFDGLGWTVAFQDGQLTGIHDFGAAGIGPRHRDFVYASFKSHDLVRHMLPIYGQRTGLMPDARRVSRLTGWHRLWELVTADPGAGGLP